jgi:hypothetical protein
MNNNFKSLTLEKKTDNKLNNVVCYEYINRQRLDLLINSTLMRIDTRYNRFEPEKEQMINYLVNSVNDNKIKVNYKREIYGRALPDKSHGLHAFRKEIRYAISENYIDIDINNAHPVIIEQILLHNNINCDEISLYINNRDGYLKLVMDKYDVSREIAKTLFLSILYGGSYKKWIIDNNFTQLGLLDEVVKYHESIRNIMDLIVANNAELSKWIINKKKQDNINKASVMSYYLQEKEALILEALFLYCVEKKYIIDNNCVLCCDGIMIPKKNYNENILSEFNKVIRCKFNINLNFTVKENINIYTNEFIEDNIVEIKDNIEEIKDITDSYNEEINELNIKLMTSDNKKNIIKQLEVINKDFNKLSTKLIKEKNNIINNLINANNKIIKKKKTINNKKVGKDDEDLSFEIDERYINVFNGQYMNSLDTYFKKKIYFELFVCKVRRPDVIYIYIEDYNRNDIGVEMVIYKSSDLAECFREIVSGKYDELGNSISMFTYWAKDPEIRCYNKLDFIPYNNKDEKDNIDINTYNLFNGYNKKIHSVYNKENQHNIIKPWLDLAYSLCGEDDKVFNYFVKYIAHMIQKPNEKIPICFIFIGKQGTGKNMMLEGIANIIGKKNYITSSNVNDFFGTHSEGFYKKILVNLNELEGKDTVDLESKLKSFISEDTITINQKYIRPMTISNVSRLIITTNKPNPIKIDVSSTDRRYVVSKGTDKFLDPIYNSIFWTKMKDHIKSESFIAACYDYFNNMDISNIDWRNERPITLAYKQLCAISIPIEAMFLEEYINNFQSNFIDSEDELTIKDVFKLNNKDNKQIVKLKSLYEDYNLYCFNNGFSKDKNEKISIKKFKSKIETLELPIEIYLSSKVCTLKFKLSKVRKELIKRGFIESDDKNDKIEVDEEIIEEIKTNQFLDYFV